MKDMQEFEQVERRNAVGWVRFTETVKAADYDALLAYTKELQKKLDARFHVPTCKLVREAIIAASRTSKEQPK